MPMRLFGPGKKEASGATPRPELQSPLAHEENPMRMSTNISRANIADGRKLSFSSPAARKAALVALGLQALTRGDWFIVAAITRIIQARGWRHE
jgi:hypothetical protein